MDASASEEGMIKIEMEDAGEGNGDSSSPKKKGKKSSTPTSSPSSSSTPRDLKFLQRIRWHSVTPTTGLFGVSALAGAGSGDDALGDLSLFSCEIYKEYIVCVGGTSQTHGPFKGYRFIPTLHVTDAYTPGCCCCSGRWAISATWKTREAKGDIPPTRYGQRTALINNTLFMFGGRVPDTNIFLNDLYALDLESMIWTHLKSSNNAPSPRIRHTLTYVDGFLYLLGGNGNEAKDSLWNFVKDSFWRYDIRTGEWDALPPPPTNEGGIAGHAAAALESQSVVVFGGCSSILGREPYLFSFDTVSGKWVAIRAQNSEEVFTSANTPEDHAVTVFHKEGATFFAFHGGISTAAYPNQLAFLKHQNYDFSWHVPIIKDVNIYRPPIELCKHNIAFVKGRLLFLGGSSEFARESEELAKVGCCGMGSYSALSSNSTIPVIELFKKDSNQGCCTIL